MTSAVFVLSALLLGEACHAKIRAITGGLWTYPMRPSGTFLATP